MSKQRVRALAWGLAGLTVVGGTVQLILWAVRLTGRPTFGEVVEAVGWGLTVPIVFSILAALIISRQPDNRVGWLMMVVGLSVHNPALYVPESLLAPADRLTPGLWLLLWIDTWSWIPTIFPLFLIPLHFPTGRPPSPGWNWVNRVAVALVLVFVVAVAFADRIGPLNADWTMSNPIGFIPADILEGPVVLVWGLTLVGLVLASVASLVVRYRRAGESERQQIKWLLFAVILFALLYSSAFFLSNAAYAGWKLLDFAFVLSILAIPSAIAVAIFRYRLWDLDMVINRALVYGPLTTLLAGIFAMVITFTTEVANEALGDGSQALGAALSAVVVAVVFQPLRSWLETQVDKRFYPQKLDLESGLVEVQPAYWGFLDRDTLLKISLSHVSRVLGSTHTGSYVRTERDTYDLIHHTDGRGGEAVMIALTEEQLAGLNQRRVVPGGNQSTSIGYVPIYVDRGEIIELLGLMSIGDRRNGKGYSGDDLKGLVRLGGKIGLALNAIYLRERLEGKRPMGESAQTGPP